LTTLGKFIDSYNAISESMILGSGAETSIKQLFDSVRDHLGVMSKPKNGLKAIGDIRRMRYDCTKAKEILKWTAETSLDDDMGDILKYLT